VATRGGTDRSMPALAATASGLAAVLAARVERAARVVLTSQAARAVAETPAVGETPAEWSRASHGPRVTAPPPVLAGAGFGVPSCRPSGAAGGSCGRGAWARRGDATGRWPGPLT